MNNYRAELVPRSSNTSAVRFTRSRARTLALAAALAIGGVVGQSAHAVPILDQSSTGGTNLVNVINGCCYFVAQTFTAGVTGRLTGVAVDANGTGQLRIDIQSVFAGLPTGTVLGGITLPGGASPFANVVEFADVIDLIAGNQYAIVLSEIGGTGSWVGTTGDLYSGGQMLDLTSGGNWLYQGLGYDEHFRTYVEPGLVAEPATLLLAGIGLAALSAVGRRRPLP